MNVRDIVPLWRIVRLLDRMEQARRNKIRLFSQQMLNYNVAAARRHGVGAACHPRDLIYEFLVKHPSSKKRLKPAVDYYFDDGARSAEKIGNLIANLGIQRNPVRLLEFASGYGCVTRHLTKNPDLTLVACDIHDQAIDFIRDELGVRSVLSAHLPENFALGERFDVVFALSFFSHMPRTTFGRWIKALFSHLASPGYLIFTTHGLASRKSLGNPEIPADGIWFLKDSEQSDLSTAEYGSSIVTEDFVKQQVLEQTGQAIFDYKHAFWWAHQDLWIVKNG
jgi:SAM-dependent methyltransferase